MIIRSCFLKFLLGAMEIEKKPMTQRCLDRPDFEQLFSRRKERDKGWRNRKTAVVIKDRG